MKYILGTVLIGLMLIDFSISAQQLETMNKEILLPAPQLKGNVSTEEAIAKRRSKRSFRSQDLSLEQISQLLWAAQGITDQQGRFRAAPSAGAAYPMEIYLLNQDGLFHYLPQGHKLEQVTPNDLREQLARACLGQDFLAQAPVDLVIAAVYARVTSRYGQRGRRYTDIEVGHIAQNVHLQAQALGLSSVPVGAFDDDEVKQLLQLPEEEEPLYIIPVGYVK